MDSSLPIRIARVHFYSNSSFRNKIAISQTYSQQFTIQRNWILAKENLCQSVHKKYLHKAKDVYSPPRFRKSPGSGSLIAICQEGAIQWRSSGYDANFVSLLVAYIICLIPRFVLDRQMLCHTLKIDRHWKVQKSFDDSSSVADTGKVKQYKWYK